MALTFQAKGGDSSLDRLAVRPRNDAKYFPIIHYHVNLDQDWNIVDFLHPQGKLSSRQYSDWELSGYDVKLLKNIMIKFQIEKHTHQFVENLKKIVGEYKINKVTKRVEQMLDKFKSRISKISHVIRIEASQEDHRVNVWTFLEKRDVGARDKIYDVELDLIREYSDLQIDFHVLSDPERTFSNTKIVFSKID
jgi:hypothetical protein